MRRWQKIGLALVAFIPTTSLAQTVQGVVADAGDRPISGVVLVLLDSASNQVARALSGDRGDFRLVAPGPGTYRVRSTRIGFRPLVSDPLVLGAGETTRPRLVISSFGLGLDTIRVQARSACSLSRRDSAAAAWRVWEQVRAALNAGAVTAGNKSINVSIVSYERSVELSRKTIIKQTARVRSDFVRQPWREVSYQQLRAKGYVDASGDSTAYLAPGVDALLADAFLEDHCFRLRLDDSLALKLEFEPTGERKRVPEVRGTVWVDRRTSELRRLEFRYVNVPTEIEDNAGGDMDFARFRNGAWAISRWNIRMPDIQLFPRDQGKPPEARVTGWQVKGGQLVAATLQGDTLWVRTPVILSGTIIDSLSQKPIQAARVGLAGTDVSVFTDRRGRFSATDVMPGSYSVEISTPSLDSIGAVKTIPLVITDSMPPLRIAVPTGSQMSEQICGKRVREGVVFGTAFVRGDTISRPGIVVSVDWIENKLAGLNIEHVQRGIDAKTDPSGTFALCDVPMGVPLAIRAKADSATAGKELQLPKGQRFARVDLILDRGRRPVSGFAGVVVTDSTRAPISNAQVFVGGRLGISDGKGEFQLTEIPVGRQHVSVRRLGYAPLETDLEFVADETLRRALALTPITMLDSVLVTARMRDPAMDDFQQHRKLGLGKFITRADLENNGGRQLSDIVRQTTPSMIPVRMYDGKAYLMNRRRGCYSAVYVDGIVMYKGQADKSHPDTPMPRFDINSLGVSATEAIEMFNGPTDTPAQYMGLNTECGVVVIHTRRPDKAKPPL